MRPILPARAPGPQRIAGPRAGRVSALPTGRRWFMEIAASRGVDTAISAKSGRSWPAALPPARSGRLSWARASTRGSSVLVIHGVWLPGAPGLAVWAEDSTRAAAAAAPPRPRRPGSARTPSPPATPTLAAAARRRRRADPARHRAAHPAHPGRRAADSPELVRTTVAPPARGPVTLAGWRVPTLVYAPDDALALLRALDELDGGARGDPAAPRRAGRLRRRPGGPGPGAARRGRPGRPARRRWPIRRRVPARGGPCRFGCVRGGDRAGGVATPAHRHRRRLGPLAGPGPAPGRPAAAESRPPPARRHRRRCQAAGERRPRCRRSRPVR